MLEDRFQDIIDKKQGTNLNFPKSYYDLKKYRSKLYNNKNFKILYPIKNIK